jgi:hypothetical protein
MHYVVTAAVGVICGVAALLIATVGRMQWPRLVVALTLTAAAGLLNSTFGGYIHTGATMADHWVGQGIGKWSGTIISGLVGAVVLALVGFRIYHDVINGKTLALVSTVPATVTLIPGLAGTIATTVVGIVPWILSGIVSLLFFGSW